LDAPFLLFSFCPFPFFSLAPLPATELPLSRHRAVIP
jgi:hypothetical protein